MKHVLIVDDEESLLLTLQEGLQAYSDQFRVITARDGQEAVYTLSHKPVDLVVTDLKMPKMGGLRLLAYMSRNHPEVPVIVMTAYGTHEIERQIEELGYDRYLEKPLDFDVLTHRIFDALKSAEKKGHIKGITIDTFLQLVEMEKKTYTLKIEHKGRFGFMYFRDGEILDAETGGLTGEEAAYEIISWYEPAIKIFSGCRKKKKNIEVPLTHLLMEGFRIRDERGPDVDEGQAEMEVEVEMEAPEPDEPPEAAGDPRQARRAALAEGFESLLEELRTVKGYVASAILSFTGELLVGHTFDKHLDLGLIGATLNDVFRSTDDACGRIGFETCETAAYTTPGGVLLMCGSAPGAEVRFHLMAVLKPDGNQALMKIKLRNLLPVITNMLS
ncbi:response regulator [Dissulfurirhabdus thermomarina]|uniref:Response regulator n=1 Tax=Dissulfurirhabdus thermomarina TaxID=1765737 RepID=A0A6N9TQA6_DISTH|nr:response regulator [Dissulfurirhabdus thermomarina]NDY41617.1 response regulator [Dissulfurirhabdus thermomarina]NMX23340.1 response regulator [Dissulfurirhabdus thermomarina]